MLIKCPECGHMVSDKAPVCPNCGIEIAGHIDNSTPISQPVEEPVVEAQPVDDDDTIVQATPVVEPASQPINYQPQQKPKKQRSHTTLWISFFIAAVLCAAMLYVYKDASDQLAADKVVNTDKLRTMKEDVDSSLIDPNYKQNTKQHMEETQQEPQLEEETTEEPEPQTVDNSKPSNADMEKATNAVRRFFRAINSHDKEALSNSVSPFLSTFNGKERATKLDVQQYMTDLYQADVKNINWYVGEIKGIDKREVGENRYEYDITLEAKKVTEREGGTSTHNYIIKAMVEDDGKVGAMTINKK